jgi:hypothetical protein
MKKKIALMLVAFALCLCAVGCSDIDRATAADFAFSAGETDNTVYSRGAHFSMQARVTNVSDKTFRYVDCQHDNGVSATLYCETESGEYQLEIWHIQTADVCYRVRYTFEPGETAVDTFDVSVPNDAPLGAYHMRISFKGFVGIVENVLTIVERSPSAITETGEEKFDPDATVADIAFSYHLIDHETRVPVDKTTFRPDEAINILGYITNVSDKVLTYTKVRGMFVKLCLYCETDDGRYEMPYFEMKHNTVPPQEVEFVPGRTVVENRYLFYSEDHNAPAGTYHLEISVPGFQQTFYGVLTVVE